MLNLGKGIREGWKSILYYCNMARLTSNVDLLVTGLLLQSKIFRYTLMLGRLWISRRSLNS